MYINYENRIFGLDVVRAVAILLVIFSHSTLLIFPEEENITLNIIRFFGTIGVDLFFVLSGYLIGNIILRQLDKGYVRFKDFLYFWIRRWFRTLPNYFLILLLNILVFYILYDDIFDGIETFFVFLQNFVNPHPDFFTEAWSLSIEEYAYIIGPILLFLFLRLFKRVSKGQIYLVMVISIILMTMALRLYFHFSHSILSNSYWSQHIRKVVVYRLDSIYFGFLAAYLIRHYFNYVRHRKNIFFYFGIIMFFGLHALIFRFGFEPENMPLFYNFFYLPLLSISLLLFFPICIYWRQGKFFKREVTSISILSYALYLVNYSLILLSMQYFINVDNLSVFGKLLMLLIYWFLSFTSAYLLHTYYEKPIMDLRDSKYFKRISHNQVVK